MRIGIVVSTLLVLVATAQAGVVIDTRPGNGPVGIGVNDWVGQTFTAVDSVLSLFGFELVDVPTYDLVVAGAVYGSDGTKPTGSALYTSSTVNVTTQGTYSFTPNLSIVPGQAYAITIESSAGSGGVYGHNPSAYAGGNFFYNAGSGTPWFSNPNDDASVLIVMNPEPSTLMLFGVGLTVAAAAALRRRRSTSSPRRT